ncbi:MAG: tRNA/rRNA methyltransferase [Chlamydiae bacterium]|nr:tRNA/rRNA methyltransferase [Chlamydiota bacterium]
MKNELKYYGIHSCLKLFEKRKEDIVRVYIHESHLKEFKPILKWCSDQKKAYHIIPNNELEKVTGSVHHEGVCFLAKEKKALSWEKAFQEVVSKKDKTCLLYLDGVENPHNIGSIVRALAHFGISYILGKKDKLFQMTPSAYRIARGGAEYVDLIALDKPIEVLKSLKKKGFSLITTSSHGGKSLYQYNFPHKSIIIMGSESDGVSKEIFSLASEKIQISGTGFVESLNVSIATTLCVAEYCRQNNKK